jgi:hypothetical protein
MLAAIDHAHAAAPYALFNAVTAYDGLVCHALYSLKAKVIQRGQKVKGKRQR